MLGFFGIRQQALDVGHKHGFRVWNFLIWRRIAHVLIVVCPCVSFGAVKVDFPSATEAATMQPWNEWPEVFNSGLQCREKGMEFSVNGVSIARPVFRFGIEASKDSVDGGAEHSASISATSMPLSPEREPVSSEWRKEDSNEGYQCDGYCGLYFSLPLWIVAFWCGLRTEKPNVELTGAARLYRAASSDRRERG